MSRRVEQNTPYDLPMRFRILLKGHLGADWSPWFGGLAVTLLPGGETLLTTPPFDQAALYGLLKRVRDCGLGLISINPLKDQSAESPD